MTTCTIIFIFSNQGIVCENVPVRPDLNEFISLIKRQPSLTVDYRYIYQNQELDLNNEAAFAK